MTRDEANKEAKKIYAKWSEEKEKIKEKAIKDGTWSDYGLDSNNHLFKKIDEEIKEKLKELSSKIDEK